MNTVLWVKLGSKGSSRVSCEKIGFRVWGLGSLMLSSDIQAIAQGLMQKRFTYVHREPCT